ncbi:LacI family DNA-binding transcriptional regulator [Kribbella sandramycini]|uniref:DNA-binding LacI/PurR family transcriptional regulator n=1 Tax=Kribbella sandramycini TaxID=60450 RepID=A0A7Y4L054_9ACTN|nr:LacI family DNA-binding transcriptional regulator [Kribbella sandramycini]MBB6565594.1 DNA-binding LacI/PurR family transcriptional regulator [Kribbella sandramycini]NOL41858.1 LacI family DNA-binding transcriptional regulator [Kribbella sandramycini]
MATRLSDVAARAGVSVKTVSNVINDYPHITAHTRAKVEAAIAALDYRPNVSARSLRKGRSDFIALAIPEMASAYFAELGAAFSRAAKKRGITVLIEQTEGESAAEQLVLDGMRGQLIDGIVFSPITSTPAKIGAAASGKPLILLGERTTGGTFDHVAVDSVQAAFDATTHLISLGRQRIAAIGVGGGGASGTGAVRRKGYRKALKAAGIAHDPALELAGTGYHRLDGAASMRELLALPEPPDAVFCFNDLLALGALRTLADAGLSVPGDVAVVGFDDIEDGRYHSPSLTTISPDKEWLAEHTVALLLERIAGSGEAERRSLTVPYTLEIRESTAG